MSTSGLPLLSSKIYFRHPTSLSESDKLRSLSQPRNLSSEPSRDRLTSSRRLILSSRISRMFSCGSGESNKPTVFRSSQNSPHQSSSHKELLYLEKITQPYPVTRFQSVRRTRCSSGYINKSPSLAFASPSPSTRCDDKTTPEPSYFIKPCQDFSSSSIPSWNISFNPPSHRIVEDYYLGGLTPQQQQYPSDKRLNPLASTPSYSVQYVSPSTQISSRCSPLDKSTCRTNNSSHSFNNRRASVGTLPNKYSHQAVQVSASQRSGSILKGSSASSMKSSLILVAGKDSNNKSRTLILTHRGDKKNSRGVGYQEGSLKSTNGSIHNQVSHKPTDTSRNLSHRNKLTNSSSSESHYYPNHNERVQNVQTYSDHPPLPQTTTDEPMRNSMKVGKKLIKIINPYRHMILEVAATEEKENTFLSSQAQADKDFLTKRKHSVTQSPSTTDNHQKKATSSALPSRKSIHQLYSQWNRILCSDNQINHSDVQRTPTLLLPLQTPPPTAQQKQSKCQQLQSIYEVNDVITTTSPLSKKPQTFPKKLVNNFVSEQNNNKRHASRSETERQMNETDRKKLQTNVIPSNVKAKPPKKDTVIYQISGKFSDTKHQGSSRLNDRKNPSTNMRDSSRDKVSHQQRSQLASREHSRRNTPQKLPKDLLSSSRPRNSSKISIEKEIPSASSGLSFIEENTAACMSIVAGNCSMFSLDSTIGQIITHLPSKPIAKQSQLR